MQRVLCRFTVSVLFLACAIPGVVAEFRAAAARVDITPPAGLDMWGYSNRKSGSTGTLDPLYARVLVLSDGEKTTGS